MGCGNCSGPANLNHCLDTIINRPLVDGPLCQKRKFRGVIKKELCVNSQYLNCETGTNVLANSDDFGQF